MPTAVQGDKDDRSLTVAALDQHRFFIKITIFSLIYVIQQELLDVK
jgi:hypothetical protein